MYLVQLLLPLYDNDGRPFGRDHFDAVRNELAREFGGVTAFRRAPAEGVWVQPEGEVSRDEVVIFEVMAQGLERGWWTRYRRELEARFRQDRVVIRATEWEQL
ncbi:MAG TPA: hypothetical protein VM864_10135 [Pyrinomonadaceae bacterium]|jgi:hypothetical protein|nr:hypothetical protein [Pyrinomonadaceae bacterium]